MGHLTLVTPPAALASEVLEEVKLWVRVDFDDDDSTISGLIAQAIAHLDGADGVLGRCLLTQTWRLTVDRFCSPIEIPLAPLIAVTGITYRDEAGDTQALSTDLYRVANVGGYGAVHRKRDAVWPLTDGEPEAVAVTFSAGYGAAWENIPEPLRQAIKLHVSTLFDHRGEAAETAQLPFNYRDLIRPFRKWSV